LNVLLLIRDREVPSARYRVLQYVGHLKAAGAEVHIKTIPGGWLARRSVLRSAAEFDSVLLQKRLLRSSQARYLREHARRLVYDFDDAVLYHSSSKRPPESATRRKRFITIMRLADLVIAGNEYLRGLAAEHNAHVRVIPTALDPSKYDYAAAAHHPSQSTVTLGWIGSASTVEHIAALDEVFRQTGTAYPNVRLKLICDSFPELPGITLEKKVWNAADEARDIASMDIGLAPCKDTPWTRGKCGLKVLQYLAASRPVVCAPVGAQKEMVRDGVNGYHAGNISEWVRALDRLISCAGDRLRMGAAGRKLLEEHYTIARWAPRFVEAVTGCATRQPGARAT